MHFNKSSDVNAESLQEVSSFLNNKYTKLTVKYVELTNCIKISCQLSYYDEKLMTKMKKGRFFYVPHPLLTQ